MEGTGEERNGMVRIGEERTGTEGSGEDWRGKEWGGPRPSVYFIKQFMYTVNMIQLERTGQDWRGVEGSGEDGNAVGRAKALRFSFVINNLVI